MLSTGITSPASGPASTAPALVGSSVASGINLSTGTLQVNTIKPTITNASTSAVITKSAQYHGGCHVYGYSLGSGGTPDITTVDGIAEPSYISDGTSLSAATITGGFYRIGGGASDSNAMKGVVTYAVFYPTAHTAAQMATETTWIQKKLRERAALPTYPQKLTPVASPPQLFFVGDSLTATSHGSSVWTTTLPSLVVPYTITNWGIGGMFAVDACLNGDNRWASSIMPGATTIVFWLGTNDISVGGITPESTWEVLTECATKAKRLGARTIVTTLISRTGQDANIEAFNTIARGRYKGAGFDYLWDVADIPALGGNGANTNGACFYTDNVHLTGPGTGSCVTIRTTAYSGYGAVAFTAGAFINAMDAQLAPPTLTTATTYSQLYGDQWIIDTPTAAATVNLVDCQALTIPKQVTNGSTGFNITAATTAGDTLVGNATILPGATAEFTPSVVSQTAGGCQWIRTK